MILRLLSLFLAATAPADPVPSNFADSLRQLESLNRQLEGRNFDRRCWMEPETSGKTCNQTSDEFCRHLWDDKEGNLQVFDGMVRAGNSPKSGLSFALLDDYRALVNALPRLPADFREAAGPAIRRLKKLLDREEDSDEWKRKIARAKEEIQEEAKAIVDARAEKAKKNGGTPLHLDDEITQAKYARHPNWRRVERLFPQAKEDLIQVLEDLPLNAERKKLMIERVRTVNLLLPVSTVAEGKDCATTQVNAMYSPEHHVFTVCAGMFNAYATDSGLYQTIVHEIAHAIDPGAESTLAYRSNSPVSRSLSSLVGAKGPAMSCEAWQETMAMALDAPVPAMRVTELEPFLACLESRSQLKPWSPELIQEFADQQTRQLMGKLAKAHVFLKLAQPDFTEKGKRVPNKLFLRPDLVPHVVSDEDTETHPVEIRGHLRDPGAPEVFAQALACQETRGSDGKRLRYLEVNEPGARQELFRKALDQTAELMKRAAIEKFSYCGQSCSELTSPGFAKDPSENFADWMANRASRYLYARIATAEQRRDAAALGNSLLCDNAGPKRDAPELALEERKTSIDEHADDRLRRLSEYDAFVAHQLGCTLGPNQGFAACHP